MSELSNNPIPQDSTEYPIYTHVYEDQKTHDKIRRHLSDINDVITEEDIRNVKTDMGVVHENGSLETENEDGKLEDYNEKPLTRKQEDKEFKESQKVNSTWNLLDE